MRVIRAHGVWMAFFALVLLTGGVWAEVVGKSAEPLSSQKVREAECSLGDLVADAARAAGKADLALVQASQLRQTTIPAGDLTRDALTGALLYPDEQVVVVTVSGAQVRAALERGISMLPKPSTAFLQVSGITVTFRSTARPGERIDGVTVGRTALSPDKKYRAAMPASLAKGALGYFRIFKGVEAEATDRALGDALGEYVSNKEFSPPKDKRLRDLSPPGG